MLSGPSPAQAQVRQHFIHDGPEPRAGLARGTGPSWINVAEPGLGRVAGTSKVNVATPGGVGMRDRAVMDKILVHPWAGISKDKWCSPRAWAGDRAVRDKCYLPCTGAWAWAGDRAVTDKCCHPRRGRGGNVYP
jgi:hypothetical protein